jgi:hypothetical protein
MIKFIAIACLGTSLGCGAVTAASAQALAPPLRPHARYVMPVYPPYPLYEGRSVFRMEDPGAFWSGTDESGYQTGEPQNPRTGD